MQPERTFYNNPLCLVSGRLNCQAGVSMFMMTYNQAMTIQRAQMVWYRQSIGRAGIKAIQAQTKCPVDIKPDEPMTVAEINGLVPRGGSFETYIKPYRGFEIDQNRGAWHDAIRRGLQ